MTGLGLNEAIRLSVREVEGLLLKSAVANRHDYWQEKRTRILWCVISLAEQVLVIQRSLHDSAPPLQSLPREQEPLSRNADTPVQSQDRHASPLSFLGIQDIEIQIRPYQPERIKDHILLKLADPQTELEQILELV
jgi:hypothetical protein